MIIFLYGGDTFRSRRMLQEMKKKFIKDVDPESQSLSVVEGAATDLTEISEKINTGSLFVKKRLVVIENIFKNKKEKIFAALAEYLKKLSAGDDNIIIFWDEELDTKNKPLKAESRKLFSFLAKQKYVQRFDPLTSAQLLSFIKKEVSGFQKDINATAASLLINLTGSDLWLIAQNLKKLAFYTPQKMIIEADVKEMVTGSFAEDIFAFTDALSAKNKVLASRLLEEQSAAGLSDEYLLAMLIRQFKILLQIREALDDKLNPNEMASQLKLHPFVAKKGALQAKNFTRTALQKHLDRLIRLDFLNKTGQGDVRTELTLLISQL